MATKQEMSQASNQALGRIFSQGAEPSQNDAKSSSMGISTPKTQKPQNGANKTVKKVFSFRGNADDVIKWRLYADARSGMTMDEIGREALNEYMNNHPLSKIEKDVFNAKMKSMNS